MQTTTRKLGEIMAEGTFKLPIGLNRDGKVAREIEIGYMTGELDAKIVDPKVRTNAGKVITEIVSAVTDKLGGKPKLSVEEARRLYTADREFILVVNYLQSVAEDTGVVKWEEQCPSCKEAMELEFDMNEVLVHYLAEGQETTRKVTLPHGISHEGQLYKEVVISIPTGAVQEKVTQTINQDPGESLTQLIAEMVEDITGLENYNRDTFRTMIKKDRNAIQKSLDEIFLGPDLRTKCSCPICGMKRKTQVPFNILMGE